MKINSKAYILVLILLICGLLLILADVAVYIYQDNMKLDITELSVESSEIPASFDGFKIVQVSDLHNSEIGEDNSRLLENIKKAEPDIILITGDLIDARRPDKDIAISFTLKAAEIAPVYYSTGNHEESVQDELKEFIRAMENADVHILRDRSEYIERGGERIQIVGMEDPSFIRKVNPAVVSERVVTERMNGLVDESEYSVVLYHRPERFEWYCKTEADLIFSGHAHGGQFRFPLIGGVYAPNQGLFPKYEAGVFEANGTTMIVSRGLGQSLIPFRINNSPELIVTTLRSE